MPSKTEDTTDLVDYTVLAGAVTVHTGRLNPQNKKPEIVRLVRGETIRATEDDPQVLTLLSMRAIREKSKAAANPDYVLTPREVLKAFRGEVLAKPVEEVKPIPAPNPVTSPESLTSEDL